MFEKILVPVDLTEKNRRAVEFARDLARMSGADVTLLHVIEPLDLPFEELEDFYRELEARAAESMVDLADPFREAGMEILEQVVYGDRAREIVAYAGDDTGCGGPSPRRTARTGIASASVHWRRIRGRSPAPPRSSFDGAAEFAIFRGRTGSRTSGSRNRPPWTATAMDEIDRRSFLRRAAGTVGLALIPPSLGGLVAASTGSAACGTDGRAGRTASRSVDGGYGRLFDRNGVMALPEGFRMRSFGAVGDRMSDGNVTPVALDGMAAFAGAGGAVRLLRNHEDRNGPEGRTIAREQPYDPAAGGGVVTLVVSPDRRLVRDFVSLNGTAVNCAGGPTPWGSWLSCEETVAGRSEGFERRHGFVFEVPASAEGPVEPRPLVEMGRFSHEAVAVDPTSGILYLTEDNAYEIGDPSAPGSGFYRFLPAARGSLEAGGRLQMARVRGRPGMDPFRGTEIGLSVGEVLEIDWVDIPRPEPDPEDELSEEERLTAVFRQGREEGAAAFARLEGCWYGDGSVFFHDTEGGAERCGQVWQYLPGGDGEGSGGRLVLVFESPGRDVLDGPDNITVSPRGGIVICEDGEGAVQYLRGLTRDGEIFDFGANLLNGYELAGATFGPDGRTLFVNIQGPTSGTPEDSPGEGRTLAIWGPWERGAL